MRIGIGYDSHKFSRETDFILGGVQIPFHKGLQGHSDADVLVHAIMDAIIGALGEGDIGQHFPDTDPEYAGISSMELLRQVLQMAADEDYRVQWCDCTIICQAPKLAPYIDDMLEEFDMVGLTNLNIKAKSNEHMGFEGRGEGVSAMAACLLLPVDDEDEEEAAPQQ